MIDELLRIANLAGDKLFSMQEEVLRKMRERGPLQQKGLGDFATEADLASERLILAELEKSFPGIPVVAEESIGTGELPETYLTVDPLDGTIIYSRGCPEWGATIGYIENGTPQCGCIVYPALNEEITAVRGKGVLFNGEEWQLKPRDPSEKIIFAVDTFYNTIPAEISGVLLPLVERQRILLSRSIGAAVANTRALLLGEVDAYYCSGAKVWDVAACVVAVEEAGGSVESLFEQPYSWRKLGKGQVFASSKAIAEEIAVLGREAFATS